MCSSFCVSQCFSNTCLQIWHQLSLCPAWNRTALLQCLSPPSVFCRLFFLRSSCYEISPWCVCNSHNPGCPHSLLRLVQSHCPSIPLALSSTQKSSGADPTTYISLLLLDSSRPSLTFHLVPSPLHFSFIWDPPLLPPCQLLVLSLRLAFHRPRLS